MVVLSNVKPGQEEEFNRWYGVHMLETINKLQGFASGQRFEQAELPGAPAMPYRYLAVYEVDGETTRGPRSGPTSSSGGSGRSAPRRWPPAATRSCRSPTPSISTTSSSASSPR